MATKTEKEIAAEMKKKGYRYQCTPTKPIGKNPSPLYAKDMLMVGKIKRDYPNHTFRVKEI